LSRFKSAQVLTAPVFTESLFQRMGTAMEKERDENAVGDFTFLT